MIRSVQGLRTKQKQTTNFIITEITETSQDHMKMTIQDEITDHTCNPALGMVHKTEDGQSHQRNVEVVGTNEIEITLHLHQMADGAIISSLNNRGKKDFQGIEIEIEKDMALEVDPDESTIASFSLYISTPNF